MPSDEKTVITIAITVVLTGISKTLMNTTKWEINKYNLHRINFNRK